MEKFSYLLALFSCTFLIDVDLDSRITSFKVFQWEQRYYDHKGLWEIVKSFGVIHSPLPKQRNYKNWSTGIVQSKHFETLERYFDSSNLLM